LTESPSSPPDCYGIEVLQFLQPLVSIDGREGWGVIVEFGIRKALRKLTLAGGGVSFDGGWT
jgi:hypothetical protein